MSRILPAAPSAGNPSKTTALTLVCFPHAGGNPATYHALAKHLPSDVHVVAYQAPARGCRFGEPPAASLTAMLDELEAPLVSATAAPCIFLGHSFGGMLAFEAARRLHQRGLPLPCHLTISGSFPPEAVSARREQWIQQASSSDGELFDYMAERGGVPADLIAHRDAFLPLMPSMRAEFAILRDYVPVAAPPLPLPLTTLCGEDDDVVPADAMSGWSSYVTGEISHRILPGSHYYFDSHAQAIAACLTEVAMRYLIVQAY